MVDESLLVARHAEEIVLLGNLLRRYLMIGTKPVNQLLLCQESLAATAIETGIFVKIDIPTVVYLLQNSLHSGNMSSIGSSDKFIRLYLKKWPCILEKVADPVSIFLWCDILPGRRLGDFIAVLIGSCLEANHGTGQSAKSTVGVGNDCGVGMTEMRLGIHVINRRCYICIHVSVR